MPKNVFLKYYLRIDVFIYLKKKKTFNYKHNKRIALRITDLKNTR